MTELINSLSQKISPNVAGIIWLTDKKITLETKGLYELNYLFNGLLIKSIINREDSNNKDFFFISTSFGKNFFLSQITLTENDPLKSLEQHLSLMESSVTDKDKIFIFTDSNEDMAQNYQKKISKKYQAIEFEVLKL
jgi:hypothetical protein